MAAPARASLSSSASADAVFALDNDSNLEEIRGVMRDVEGADGLRAKLASADPTVRAFVAQFESEAFALIEQYHGAAAEAMAKRDRMGDELDELRNQNEALRQEMDALREVVAFHADVDRLGPPLLGASGRSLSSSAAPAPAPAPAPTSQGRFAARRRGHRRVQSHHELSRLAAEEARARPVLEVEPGFFRQFQDWCGAGYDAAHPLMERVLREDVEPCLRFDDAALGAAVLRAIRAGTLCLEPIAEKDQEPGRRCALVAGRACAFRMRLMDADEEHQVCQFARNRVIAACEFFTYLKHLQMKLVRAEETKILAELQSLRKQMALARLGFPPEGR